MLLCAAHVVIASNEKAPVHVSVCSAPFAAVCCCHEDVGNLHVHRLTVVLMGMNSPLPTCLALVFFSLPYLQIKFLLGPVGSGSSASEP